MQERSVQDGADRRARRGLQAWRGGAVAWSGGWVVAGSSGAIYHVSLACETCECPDHAYRGIVCAHIHAATVARAKTRRCSGCGEPTPRTELVELHEDNHDNLTHFHGDRLCGECADNAGVVL